MKKQQLYTRLGPDVAERVIRRFNEREMSLQHDSTPRHIWGPSDAQQHVILSLDDASRKVTAQRVCERETLLEHFAMIEESILRYGRPETYYTDGFTMFGKEGEDLCSQFGRMCRALGMNHRIAPTPQAKGKIERSMRTFQHRIVVVLKAEGVDSEIRANVVAREHIDFWCRTHVNDETGEIPDERMQRLVAEGSPVASVVPLDEMRFAEGNGLSRLVDFSVATVAIPGATGRASCRASRRSIARTIGRKGIRDRDWMCNGRRLRNRMIRVYIDRRAGVQF